LWVPIEIWKLVTHIRQAEVLITLYGGTQCKVLTIEISTMYLLTGPTIADSPDKNGRSIRPIDNAVAAKSSLVRNNM
jgi:hypothetical protein